MPFILIVLLYTIIHPFLIFKGQEFFWVPQKLFLAEQSQKLYVFGENQLAIYDPKTLEILESKTLLIDSSLTKSFLGVHFFERNEDVIGVQGESGRVYMLQDTVFKRIDRSKINEGLHNGFTFQHQDTLFRYGGYGFWKVSRQLIFYDENTRGWEIYPIRMHSELPPELFSITGFYKNGKLYTFNGISNNPYNPIENTINKEFWAFDFATRSWEEVPKSADFNYPMNQTPIPNHELLYLQSSSKILAVDPEESNYQLFEPNPLYFKAVNRNDLLSFDAQYAYFVTLSTDGFKIENAPLSFFLSNRVAQGTYLRDYSLVYFSIGLFLLGTILILFWLQKRLEKRISLHLHSDFVRYKSSRIPINSIQFNVFFELKDHREVLASHIKDLVHTPELSNAQNERNKLLLIQNLNQNFNRLIGKKIIHEKRSPMDKRIKLYVLDDTIKIIIKKN